MEEPTRRCKKCGAEFSYERVTKIFCSHNCAKGYSAMALRRTQTNPEHYCRDRAREKKAVLVAYKGGMCHDCGGIFPSCCYHFDHRDPFEKSFNIGGKVSLPIEDLKVEVDKCDMVCANCHAIRTFGNEQVSQKIRNGRFCGRDN